MWPPASWLLRGCSGSSAAASPKQSSAKGFINVGLPLSCPTLSWRFHAVISPISGTLTIVTALRGMPLHGPWSSPVDIDSIAFDGRLQRITLYATFAHECRQRGEDDVLSVNLEKLAQF